MLAVDAPYWEDAVQLDRFVRTVVWSFPVAFALHDTEEVLAAGAWGESAAERLRARWPDCPERVIQAVTVTGPEAAVAVGLVGTGVLGTTALAASGHDRHLRSFQAMLAAFSLHGLVHLVQAIAFRGYTPGVVTVPVVIAPYSWWAWRRLGQAGVADVPLVARLAGPGLAGAYAAVLAGHLLGRALLRPEGRTRLRRAWARLRGTQVAADAAGAPAG